MTIRIFRDTARRYHLKLTVLFLTVLAAAISLPAATVNFDTGISGVTCCFGSSAQGPFSISGVTIADAGSGGYVMSGAGWNNQQTSGDNLYGTESGSIFLNFAADAADVSFDLINGSGSFTFTVTLSNASEVTLSTSLIDLTSFGSPGGVAHFTSALSGVRNVSITGNGDFAIDTIVFNEGASSTPEPSTLLLAAGVLVAGFARRRRRAERTRDFSRVPPNA